MTLKTTCFSTLANKLNMGLINKCWYGMFLACEVWCIGWRFVCMLRRRANARNVRYTLVRAHRRKNTLSTLVDQTHYRYISHVMWILISFENDSGFSRNLKHYVFSSIATHSVLDIFHQIIENSTKVSLHLSFNILVWRLCSEFERWQLQMWRHSTDIGNQQNSVPMDTRF